MNEEKLTTADRKTLKLDLKISYIVGLFFLVAAILFIVVIFFGGTLFGFKPKDGFIHRSIYIFSIFFFIMVIVWTSYFKHYIDLIKGVKVSLTLNQFQLVTEKDKTYLISNDMQYRRIEVYEGLLKFIDSNRSLKIELAKHSKAMLFISHDTHNYLNKPI
jgi:hypothetical protein